MRPLVFAALVFSAVPALAQVTLFESGYVVVDGERVPGAVALATDVQDARSVRFRGGDGVLTLTPADIDGWGTEAGRRYRTVRVTVEADTVSAFARVVRDGRADLLVLRLGDREVPVVALGDGAVTALPTDLAGRRSALAPIVAECPSALADPSFESVVALVDRFNACVDEVDAAGPMRTGPRTGVSAEFAFGTLWTRYTLPGPALTEDQNTGSFGPSAAVAVAVRTAWAPRVQAVLEARYTRTGIVFVSDRPSDAGPFGSGLVTLTVGQVGLGLRAEVARRLGLGAGVLVGRGSTSAPLLSTAGEVVVNGVPVSSLSHGVGGYLEASVRPLGPSLHLLTRVETASLSGARAEGGAAGARADGGSLVAAGFGLRWEFAD